MKKHMKFCVVCGRMIPGLSLRKTTCSGFCRRTKKAGYTPYIDTGKPLFKKLTDIQEEVRKAKRKANVMARRMIDFRERWRRWRFIREWNKKNKAWRKCRHKRKRRNDALRKVGFETI